MTGMDTEQQLAWERRQRPRGAAAAMLAAFLTLGASLANGLLLSDRPVVGVLESLERALAPGATATQPSLRVPFFEYVQDRAAALVGTSVAQALAYLATGYALFLLATATRARRPQLPRIANYLGLFGGVLLALAGVFSTLATTLAVNDFLSGPRTVDAADDVRQSPLVITAQLVGLPGTLALALGFVLVSLNAMRAGLLTRFMGILGMIVGVLVVIPIGSGLPVVQVFWLIALGLLLLDRWPNGTPPAWQTGREEPWPTQQEIREGRQRATAGRDAQPAREPEPEPDPAPTAVAVGADAADRRRKRKRRG